ncbi:uncharacterized protein FIBRA_07170 [Fibroporia radiculosa]|uniref:Condensation domain-containing protein n=1 Tax=Fibroporia radiculosa TaxID=599839 RepID=J4I095_9APHY|nr:uncharacterized protein FIBRA_07170 [Fibroporia radiculosa]CCM04972.1 predicted protein [Fibroporia radiculosa]
MIGSFPGLLERWYITRHYLGICPSVAISAQYIGKDGERLDKATLFSALKQVILRHGALSVRISGETSEKPLYIRLSNVNLDDIVEFSDAHDLSEALDVQVRRGFDTTTDSPLWRLQVFRDGTVIFVFHHAICDGQSGLAFHRALLKALNDTQADHPAATEPSVVSIPDNTTLVEPLEHLTDLSVSILSFCCALLQLFVPESWTADRSTWTGNPVPAVEKLDAQVRLLSYSHVDAARVIDICRANKSTITSYIHTLSTLIISHLLNAGQIIEGATDSISTTIPISSRHLTNTSADEMCVHISVLHQYAPLIPSLIADKPVSQWMAQFPWDTATNLTTNLRQERMQVPKRVGFLKYLNDIGAFMRRPLGKKRKDTLEISNVGRLMLDDGTSVDGIRKPHPWSIEHMYFIQAHPASTAAVHINMVGTPSGGLGFTITWGQDAIEDAFGDAFVDMLKEAMDELLDN